MPQTHLSTQSAHLTGNLKISIEQVIMSCFNTPDPNRHHPGGQNPTLYLTSTHAEHGASLAALVYSLRKPFGFCAWMTTEEA